MVKSEAMQRQQRQQQQQQQQQQRQQQQQQQQQQRRIWKCLIQEQGLAWERTVLKCNNKTLSRTYKRST